MPAIPANLQNHIAGGLTNLCRCWAITRKDGTQQGFTDHDAPITFDGLTFKADTGLTSSALSQSTGLSVDNAEAVGVLSDASIREADIMAGRYDGASVESWVVNWANPTERWLQFRGSLGELHSAAGAFTAELRGLTDGLNRPLGRVYQKPCTAILGDGKCQFDTSAPGFFYETLVAQVAGGRSFEWPDLPGFAPEWFARGKLQVLDGDAMGLWGAIKEDRISNGSRVVELWEPIRADIQPGDRVRLTAGCDKRFATCRDKFSNLMNFQGFPDLPGEDWMMAVPKKSGANRGGSLR